MSKPKMSHAERDKSIEERIAHLEQQNAGLNQALVQAETQAIQIRATITSNQGGIEELKALLEESK